jgi:pimeloyl-ACP methyl ester carboxylesterase
VVRGGSSNVVSASVAEEMGRRMADCRVATVENAGHLVVGDNPAEFQSVVEPFFNDLF